jgi:hypothetical protein
MLKRRTVNELKVALHNIGQALLARGGDWIATQLEARRAIVDRSTFSFHAGNDLQFLISDSEPASRLSFAVTSQQLQRSLAKNELSLANVMELSGVLSARDDHSQWRCYPSGDWLYAVELTLTLKLKEAELIASRIESMLMVPSRWLAEVGIQAPPPYTQFLIHKRDDI